MFYSQRYMGWRFDAKKVYRYFADKYGPDPRPLAYYFLSKVPNEPLKQKKWKEALKYIGFQVREKLVKDVQIHLRCSQCQEWFDEVFCVKCKSEVPAEFPKADLDVDLAVELVTKVHLYDRAILMASDRDYIPAIEYVKAQGKEVFCVARAYDISPELLSVVNPNFIDLETLRPFLEREAAAKRPL